MNKHFPILAIETTSDLCSVSVQLDQNSYVEVNHLAKHVHSEKLINMIEKVVEESGIKINQYASVAISIGPGSFTGLRIGLSAAKGIAFGAKLPLISVPTFEATAYSIKKYLKEDETFSIVFNASNEDFYFEKYQIKNSELLKIVELTLVDKSRIHELMNNNELLFGNAKIENFEVRKIFHNATSISNWAYLFGQDLLTFDYDNLEPKYIKQFIGKVKK